MAIQEDKLFGVMRGARAFLSRIRFGNAIENAQVVKLSHFSRKKLSITFHVIFLLALLFFSGAEAIARTYTTEFPLTENPISEGGNWINGGTVGLDWSNVETTLGLAYGLESGTVDYTDATALITGAWGPDQIVQATVYKGTTYDGDSPEVELRLRSSLSAHVCNGYEITHSAGPGDSGYLIIVRWNGPVGNFSYLTVTCAFGGWNGQACTDATYNVNNGDVVEATISGSTISVYKNGTLEGTAKDTTFTTGSPGMGFNYGSCSPCQGSPSSYGFTSYSATDGAPNPPNPPNPPNQGSVPRAPTKVKARAGNAMATVSFKLPPNGGSPITVCTVTSKPGGVTQTGAGSPINVPCLTNGTGYTFSG